MKKILLFFALSFPALLFGQVVKTAAVPYTKGASPYTPTLATSAEIRVDTSCSCIYWWDRDNLTWMRMRPGIDVITGGVAPAYKPHDNQSLFAINADSELYYYTGSAWVLINGTGTGGIYGGSGNVPDNTVPTLLGSLDFSGGDLSSFSVATGTTVGGAMSSSFSGFAISQRDTSGSTLLDLTGNGAAFYFPGSFDRLTINDRDVRYGADYSATYSDRSLPDKEYVDGIGLQHFLEAYTTSTANTASLTADETDTNIGAAIVPKGTGAFTLAVPDGTTTGGDARGSRAIDLQMSRSASTQVASGANSIAMGRRQTASGTNSIAMGGSTSGNTASGTGAIAMGVGANATGTSATAIGNTITATGNFSTVLGAGNNANSELSTVIGGAGESNIIAQFVQASASMRYTGDAQCSKVVLSREITGTAQTEIFILPGAGSGRLILTDINNRAWNFRVDVVGACKDAGDGVGISGGEIWTSWHVGAIKNLSGTTSLVGTVQTPATAQADTGMATTVVTIDADNTNDSLRIRITPPTTAGSTTETAWVATVHLTEIDFEID